MVALSVLLSFSGLLCTARCKAFYPQAAQRPPDLLHDFQQSNVSTSWAPGHPKEWTDKEALRYEFKDGGPHRYTSGAIRAVALSSDEKLLVTLNTSHHVTVIDFATGAHVSGTTLTSPDQSEYRDEYLALRILAGPPGYDILVSFHYLEVQRLRLSPQGEQIGNVTMYLGGLLYEKDSPSTSHNERRFLTVDSLTGQYHIYDLDDPAVHIIMNNQVDHYYDASFSPDDQLVVTRSWSYSGPPGSTKMFNAATGALVRDFNDTSSETLSISPDGSLLATSFDTSAVQIWSLQNATAEPTTLNIPSRILVGGFQGLAWSPDGTYLAAGAYRNLVVWKLGPAPEVVQWLQLDAKYVRDVSGLLWLDGSSKLAYRVYGGLEVYNFETNLKYRWGFGPNSHWVDGSYIVSHTIWAEGKRWIGGLDADMNVRFWGIST